MFFVHHSVISYLIVCFYYYFKILFYILLRGTVLFLFFRKGFGGGGSSMIPGGIIKWLWTPFYEVINWLGKIKLNKFRASEAIFWTDLHHERSNPNIWKPGVYGNGQTFGAKWPQELSKGFSIFHSELYLNRKYFLS